MGENCLKWLRHETKKTLPQVKNVYNASHQAKKGCPTIHGPIGGVEKVFFFSRALS